jgi:hypothetical protein
MNTELLEELYAKLTSAEGLAAAALEVDEQNDVIGNSLISIAESLTILATIELWKVDKR